MKQELHDSIYVMITKTITMIPIAGYKPVPVLRALHIRGTSIILMLMMRTSNLREIK